MTAKRTAFSPRPMNMTPNLLGNGVAAPKAGRDSRKGSDIATPRHEGRDGAKASADIICSVRFLPSVLTTRVFLGLLFALFVSVGQSQQTKVAKTDDEIRQAIIAKSIADYRGNCPCPYNTDKAGHKCGARSAYSRPGGASPLCYAKDVTQKMVDVYRKQHR